MSNLDLSIYKNKRIAVGLSGGVDSSTVLALLAEAGADVVGLTMQIYQEKHGVSNARSIVGDACYGPGEVDDIKSASALCNSLGVPYHVINLAKEYEANILDYFKAEYKAGRTPNPCVRCNQTMKFGFLLDKARDSGLNFDFFASGHYARLETKLGVRALRQACDYAKDQTYFIHRLPPQTLNIAIFPLGALTKAQVREQARRLGLASADKEESQDFIAGGYTALFDASLPGDIVNDEGQVLGHHRGIEHYTIGQRRGIGISTGPNPVYVRAIDAKNNKIIVSNNESLFCDKIEGQDAFISELLFVQTKGQPDIKFEALVRIRQNHKPAKAYVEITGDKAVIRFLTKQRAAAPGQSAVFYDEEGFVLGGCIIDKGI